nr:TetR/AcrR family transcriptional regulator [Pseudohalocynthiibacter aestuariivivens]
MTNPTDNTPTHSPGGNVKATRDDWLSMAMDVLISDGVSHVKILGLGQRLGVSRSSFYWYFNTRQDLLDALLEVWERTNTGIVLRHAAMPSDTITQAVCLLFRAFINPALFNHKLDFAVREWARRDTAIRRVIENTDATRHAAIAAMFARHGYSDYEADVRARILYYQQIGYYALDLQESAADRIERTEGYLLGFTGVVPSAPEVEAAIAYAKTHMT